MKVCLVREESSSTPLSVVLSSGYNDLKAPRQTAALSGASRFGNYEQQPEL